MRRELKFTRWCRVLQDKDSRCTGALQQMLPTISPFLIMLTIYEINLLRPAHSRSDFVMKCCNFLFTPTPHPPKKVLVCVCFSYWLTLTHSKRGQVFREERGRKDNLLRLFLFLKRPKFVKRCCKKILDGGFCQWRNCYLIPFYNNVSLHCCANVQVHKNVLLSHCVAAALEMCQSDTKFILRAFLLHQLHRLYRQLHDNRAKYVFTGHEGSLNVDEGETDGNHFLWPHHFDIRRTNSCLAEQFCLRTADSIQALSVETANIKAFLSVE